MKSFFIVVPFGNELFRNRSVFLIKYKVKFKMITFMNYYTSISPSSFKAYVTLIPLLFEVTRSQFFSFRKITRTVSLLSIWIEGTLFEHEINYQLHYIYKNTIQQCKLRMIDNQQFLHQKQHSIINIIIEQISIIIIDKNNSFKLRLSFYCNKNFWLLTLINKNWFHFPFHNDCGVVAIFYEQRLL